MNNHQHDQTKQLPGVKIKCKTYEYQLNTESQKSEVIDFQRKPKLMCQYTFFNKTMTNQEKMSDNHERHGLIVQPTPPCFIISSLTL